MCLFKNLFPIIITIGKEFSYKLTNKGDERNFCLFHWWSAPRYIVTVFKCSLRLSILQHKLGLALNETNWNAISNPRAPKGACVFADEGGGGFDQGSNLLSILEPFPPQLLQSGGEKRWEYGSRRPHWRVLISVSLFCPNSSDRQKRNNFLRPSSFHSFFVSQSSDFISRKLIPLATSHYKRPLAPQARSIFTPGVLCNWKLTSVCISGRAIVSWLRRRAILKWTR